MEDNSSKVLIIYFSLSGQSRGLVNLIGTGLKQEGISVVVEKLEAEEKISFPFSGILYTFKIMLTTFFRWRVPIAEPSAHCFEDYDLTIVAGPTWSYNPSGPILSLLDTYGSKIFSGSRVLPVISCRGYHRTHNFFLRRRLTKLGAVLEPSLIFSHPVSEPWSSIGVFLKSAGYRPEKLPVIAAHYPRFGHSSKQLQQAQDFGRTIGRALRNKKPAGRLFPTQQSMSKG